MAGSGSGSDDSRGAPDLVAMIAAIQPSTELRGVAQSLERVCRAALENLGLLGAVVRLLPDTAAGSAVVAGEGTPERLGELEFEVGEGPGTTAFALSRPVLVPDLAGPDGDDWPGFRALALDHGVAAVFAFPLHLGAVVLGTLELYAARPGPLTADQLWLARSLAQIGVELLLDGPSTSADGSLSSGLTSMVEHRAQIAQAQGMVMVDLGITLDEAIARLRAHAFAAGTSLGELARRVIGGYVLPPDGQPTTGLDPAWD